MKILGFMKNQQRILRFISGVFVCLTISIFLTACNQKESLLRIASNVWPGYELMYLARERKYFDEKEIRLVEVPSATAAIQSLAAGNIEGAMLTLDEVLTARAEGLELVVVAVLDNSVGADVLMASPTINDLSSLKGKRIGVEKSAVGAVMLDAVLQKAELSADDVQLVYMTVNKHKSAYINKNVDALVTFEPVKTQVAKAGAKLLFDSSQIPGRIIDVLAVLPEAIKNNPKAIAKLIDSHFKARADYMAKPLDASIILSKRLQINPEEVPSSYEGIELPGVKENKSMLAGTNPLLKNSAQELVTVMQRAKLLQGDITLDHLIDSAFLPKL